MRRLSLDQLHAVVEVVQLGSFSAAARNLNLTQPAVSLQVRELEQRLGVQLVERLGKRAYATAAGAELIERAHRIEREVDDAIDAMRRRRDGGLARIRIGTGGSILAYLLPPVLRTLRRKHPYIEIVVMTGTTDEIAARIAQNDLDIALVTMPVIGALGIRRSRPLGPDGRGAPADRAGRAAEARRGDARALSADLRLDRGDDAPDRARLVSRGRHRTARRDGASDMPRCET